MLPRSCCRKSGGGRPCLWIGVAFATFLAGVVPLSADEPQATSPKSLTVREVSLFLQTGNENVLNFTRHFGSGLPIGVSSQRPSRVVKLGGTGGANQPQPLGIITFEGAETKDCEVSLQLSNGSHVAHLPPADIRSTRILWASFDLVKSPAEAFSSIIPTGHWLAALQQESRLAVVEKKFAERFLLYDVTLKKSHSIEVLATEGGYRLVLTGETPVHDFTLFRPVGNGQWTVAQLETMQATPPAKRKPKKSSSNQDSQVEEFDKPDPPTVSQIPSPESSDPQDAPSVDESIDSSDEDVDEVGAEEKPGKLAEEMPEDEKMSSTDMTSTGTLLPIITTDPVNAAEAAGLLTKRLQPLGLGDVELEYVTRMLQDLALTKETSIMVYRLDAADFDRLLPLEVIPSPARLVRVPLVIVYGIDPHLLAEVDGLIAELGNASWKVRESAQERLSKIGPASMPKLKQALKHSDPEVVYRVEQLLESLSPKENENGNDQQFNMVF